MQHNAGPAGSARYEPSFSRFKIITMYHMRSDSANHSARARLARANLKEGTLPGVQVNLTLREGRRRKRPVPGAHVIAPLGEDNVVKKKSTRTMRNDTPVMAAS